MEEIMLKAKQEIMAAGQRRLGAVSQQAVDLAATQAQQAVTGARRILANALSAETFAVSSLTTASTAGMSSSRAVQFRLSVARSAANLTAKSADAMALNRQRCAGNAKKLLMGFGISTLTADAIIDHLKKEEGW